MEKHVAWVRIGVVLFWLTWPLSWMYLHGSKRTRLLIIHGNHIIVTKRWVGDGSWSLPGGGLHKEEASLDGALRELYEETGVHLKVGQLERQTEFIYHHHNLSFNYVLFVAKVTKQSPLKHRPIELVDAQWVHRSKLTSHNAQPDVLAALHRWWG